MARITEPVRDVDAPAENRADSEVHRKECDERRAGAEMNNQQTSRVMMRSVNAAIRRR
jgi:hypothetical protein